MTGMHNRNATPPKKLRPLMASTLRQERKAFIPDGGEYLGNVLIASYNIHKCVGADGRFDPKRTIAVLKEIDADVIALQEVDQRFGDRAGLLDLNAVERETGLIPVPVKGIRSSHGWHGNITLVRNATLVRADQLALPGGEPRGALVVDLTIPAGQLRVIAAHLGLLRRSRARQVEAVLSAIGARAQPANVADGRFE
jgi:endonuclease/exonuclease/phosphatase family metal-dependent hydrolase